MKIISVVGARPNFMKVGALHRVFSNTPEISSVLVHTGQHYDAKMSDIFFNQLGLPEPNYFLGVGSGSHAETTGKIMIEFEKIVKQEQPELVLVVGDVNSTVACAMVASKLHIRLAHVEAGLRSGDRKMPEEINRIITDHISDLLFVTEDSGLENLKNEGIPDEKVFFTGNVMIDSVINYLPEIENHPILSDLELSPSNYFLVTQHRPSNVDNQKSLLKIIEILERVSNEAPIAFPMHPRTLQNLEKFGLMDRIENIGALKILEPQGYHAFLSLIANARLILTDSGGIQEEATYLKVPCVTLRTSTERPSTIQMGSNLLVPTLDVDDVLSGVKTQLAKDKGQFKVPKYWDGQAAQRITDTLLKERV